MNPENGDAIKSKVKQNKKKNRKFKVAAIHLVIGGTARFTAAWASITLSHTNTASHAIQPCLPRNAHGIRRAARWQVGLDRSRKHSHGDDCRHAHTGLPGVSKRAATTMPITQCQLQGARSPGLGVV